MSRQQGDYPVNLGSDEFHRLSIQDTLLNVLFPLFPPGVDAPKRVLDVACGAGGWLQRVATAYPHCQCFGLDKNSLLLDYASQLAKSKALTNVTYKHGDMFDLPRLYKRPFDFIQMRTASWFLGARREEMFNTCLHLLNPGGMFCVIDFIQPGRTNSTAIQQFSQYFLDALEKRGSAYANVIDFPALLSALGFRDVHKYPYVLDLSAGQADRESYMADLRNVFGVFRPVVTQAMSEDDYEALVQACLRDLDAPDLEFSYDVLMVTGIN